MELFFKGWFHCDTHKGANVALKKFLMSTFLLWRYKI